MFDLRYHVASLAAVFVALIIGIVVGVGISDRGVIDRAQNKLLEGKVARLEHRLAQESRQSASLARDQQATRRFVDQAYPVLMANRLRGKHVALVFIGGIDDDVRASIEQALVDATAAAPLHVRALKVPIDAHALDRVLARKQEFRRYVGDRKLKSLGRELGLELAVGGDSPLWDALSAQLVIERSGGGRRTPDGIVIVRSVGPQEGATAQFLAGFYAGLAAAGPAVGVEESDASASAVAVYRRAGISSIDDVDKPLGRLALALLLDGAKYGHYGLKPTATDGILPPMEALPPRSG
jgi:hypothetical protein